MADKKTKKTKKEDLMKLRVQDLREIAIKLGMPEEKAEEFDTKKPLITTINILRDSIRAKKVVDSPADKKKDEELYLSKSERMRAILMKQKRVRILIPLEGAEQIPGVIDWVSNKVTKRKEQVYVKGAYTPVQINGFKWFVPHGKYVSVPQQIADMISDAQGMTAAAGRDYLIDRKDPKTGGQVKDKLE